MIVWLALMVPSASAVRPTEGGLFAYDGADVIVFYDDPGGRVRVHYAIEGPSTAVLTDEDGDGVPDFVAGVGRHVDAAWSRFEDVGFRGPVLEADLGLGALGGSDAFDVYLLDFGGNADGAFRVDGCSGGVCAGHLTIENDFKGYGYSSLDEATVTLASHELFHGVQAAYTSELDVWISEGSAVWAQRLYDAENRDFLRYAMAYLADTGRSLDKPPAGPVPTFAYATGLWFDFLTLRHDDRLMVELMESLGDDSEAPLDNIGTVLVDRGDDWAPAFTEFTGWNLATGLKSGGLAEGGYPYAGQLTAGVRPEGFAAVYEDDPRIFPLAAVYVALDHPGGELWAGTGVCDAERYAQVAVHPEVDGVVGDAIDTIDGVGRVVTGGAVDAGRYYLVISQPEPGGSSIKERICAGPIDALSSACDLDCAPDTDDSDTDGPMEGGCGGCTNVSQSPAGPVALGIFGLMLWARRRRAQRLH
ncbi:MAG: MXAN_6640 family putative metalloprotease [Myxococcota bacterium]